VRIGRLALLSGCSATTKDIPPFVIQQNIDTVVGVNIVGMRRAGMSHEEIANIRKAFKILYREGLVIPNALSRIEQEIQSCGPVRELVAFIRNSARGINPMRERGPGLAA